MTAVIYRSFGKSIPYLHFSVLHVKYSGNSQEEIWQGGAVCA